MSALQRALPQARLMWHTDSEMTHVVASFAEEEHWLGVDLDEPGLTEESLVNSILLAVVA